MLADISRVHWPVAALGVGVVLILLTGCGPSEPAGDPSVMQTEAEAVVDAAVSMVDTAAVASVETRTDEMRECGGPGGDPELQSWVVTRDVVLEASATSAEQAARLLIDLGADGWDVTREAELPGVGLERKLTSGGHPGHALIVVESAVAEPASLRVGTAGPCLRVPAS